MFFRKEATPTIALIHLKGEIGSSAGISYNTVRRQIDEAFCLANLKAVCLVINSPGGSPVQSQLIADYIRYSSDSRNTPVYAFIEDISASGGYLIACAAELIYVSRFSLGNKLLFRI